jgi:hypothetical protein
VSQVVLDSHVNVTPALLDTGADKGIDDRVAGSTPFAGEDPFSVRRETVGPPTVTFSGGGPLLMVWHPSIKIAIMF